MILTSVESKVENLNLRICVSDFSRLAAKKGPQDAETRIEIYAGLSLFMQG